jgi:hypothetical protein
MNCDAVYKKKREASASTLAVQKNEKTWQREEEVLLQLHLHYDDLLVREEEVKKGNI